MINDDLIKINRDKIKTSNEGKRTRSTFLTLALIRNDISDLVYLQGLFVHDNNKIESKISSHSGRSMGRMIYIMRLALSHYYEFLQFLCKRKEEINGDLEFQAILKGLNKEDRAVWDNFNSLAHELELIDTIIKVKNTSIEYKVMALSRFMRGNLTFHYWGSAKFLYIGFEKAFFSDEENEGNKYPQVTEIEDVHKDRAYYIDLSIQRYLETESGLKENIFEFEKHVINVIAEVNMILNRILNAYHNKIKI